MKGRILLPGDGLRFVDSISASGLAAGTFNVLRACGTSHMSMQTDPSTVNPVHTFLPPPANDAHRSCPRNLKPCRAYHVTEVDPNRGILINLPFKLLPNKSKAKEQVRGRPVLGHRSCRLELPLRAASRIAPWLPSAQQARRPRWAPAPA